VDQASGVSARFSIANYKAMVASARRRGVLLGEKPAVPRVSDLGHLPSSALGKLELDLMGVGRGAGELRRVRPGRPLRQRADRPGDQTRADYLRGIAVVHEVMPYEKRLDQDRRWALREGSMHFEKDSAVQITLARIARKLEELGVPYACAGAMALFQHGYRRFTEDVDLLVTAEGLKTVHDKLEGLGYLPPFQGSKNLRDTETGVRIEFLVAGHYPGDGKPKPVAFPDPASAGEVLDGVRCLTLPRLIELKLASGTAAWRLKDLADVQEVIRHLRLPADFADRLDPSVRDSYRTLWTQANSAPPEEGL
jgi:hypothetical protein